MTPNHKRTFAWIAGAVLLAGAVSALRAPQGLTGPVGLFHEIRALQQQNTELEKEVADKKERLRRLSEGSSEPELEVKKRWKLLKPGETQLVLPQNAPANPPSGQ